MYDDILVISGYALSGSDWPLMMRVYHPATGELATHSDLNSLAVQVYEYDTPAVLTLDATLSTSLLVDELQRTGWTQDNEGYNLRHVLPAAAIPAAGVYRVEYTLSIGDYTARIYWRLYVTGSRQD